MYPGTFVCNKTTYHLQKKIRADWRKDPLKGEWMPVMLAGSAVAHHRPSQFPTLMSAKGEQGVGRDNTATWCGKTFYAKGNWKV